MQALFAFFNQRIIQDSFRPSSDVIKWLTDNIGLTAPLHPPCDNQWNVLHFHWAYLFKGRRSCEVSFGTHCCQCQWTTNAAWRETFRCRLSSSACIERKGRLRREQTLGKNTQFSRDELKQPFRKPSKRILQFTHWCQGNFCVKFFTPFMGPDCYQAKDNLLLTLNVMLTDLGSSVRYCTFKPQHVN